MAHPANSQTFYEIGLERAQQALAGLPAEDPKRPELLKRLEHYTTELRWYRTGSRHIQCAKVRAHDTRKIVHSPEQTAAFLDLLTTDEDGHAIFNENGGRHFRVKLDGGGACVMSVRRFAYSLAHPEDPVLESEDVQTTCEHIGDFTNGHGTCCAHLKKVPA